MIQSKSQEKLSALLEKQKQLQAQINQIEARAKAEKNKSRTRRLIILGGAVDAWANEDQAFADLLNRQLGMRVKREADRKVLGFVIEAQQVVDPAI